MNHRKFIIAYFPLQLKRIFSPQITEITHICSARYLNNALNLPKLKKSRKNKLHEIGQKMRANPFHCLISFLNMDNKNNMPVPFFTLPL